MTQPEFLHAVKEDSAKKAGDYQERSRENEISESLCGQKTLKNIKKKKKRIKSFCVRFNTIKSIEKVNIDHMFVSGDSSPALPAQLHFVNCWLNY